jgi:uroporphyrinogen-III synthase
MLESIGHAIVDTLPIYQTDFTDVMDAPDRDRFIKFGGDAIVFASSSAALSYIEQEEDLQFDKGARLPVHASFGPQTTDTLKENNLSVDIESQDSTLESMLDALINYFQK